MTFANASHRISAMDVIDESLANMTKAEALADMRKDAFWYRVDTLLANQGKTLKDLSEATELKYSTILSWRINKRLPDLSSAIDIAQFLGVLVESLTDRMGFHTPSVESIIEDAFNKIPKDIASSASGLAEARKDAENAGKTLDKFLAELKVTARILEVDLDKDDKSAED